MKIKSLVIGVIISVSFIPHCIKGQEVVKNKISLQAESFSLSDTRLLEGSPFKHAMDMDGQWLLDLNPDRLLNRFRLNAGLTPKAEIYGGWESAEVSGHTLGHYLSACSMMYAASGDERFKSRVDYIINELSECQQARKTGYVGGIPGEDKLWDDIVRGEIHYDGAELNDVWVPWYTLHKLWAGLIDTYTFTNNEKAKQILVKLSDWAVNKFGNLTDEQFQQMLASEFGGMNESLAETYALTGNKSYLVLAEKFYHKAILDPLKAKHDELKGKHANTQIPKVIGAARLYELTGNKDYYTISTFFWDRIANHRSYVNGGNSNHEHLGEPDELNDQLSPYTTETCNTYNMLKLTRHLFSWETKASYMDFYERALYNHILSSQNPDDGMVCYCVPLQSGTEKVFSTRFESFWCCVGTGLENHVKYAESIFFKAKDGGLYVNLFVPVALQWKERGLEIKMETNFPESDKVRFSFKGKKQHFPLYIRYPKWATQGLKAVVNGKEVSVKGTPGSYISINGEWGTGCSLELTIPMNIYTVSMPDNPNRKGIFYGPILLSAELGKEKPEVYDIPIFVSETNDISSSILPVSGALPLVFHTGNATEPKDIKLIPFYKVHSQYHAVYFDVFTPSDWNKKQIEYQQLMKEKADLEARTNDILRIGEMQPERDHDLNSENSETGEVAGNKYRHAYNGWFSFQVKINPEKQQQMVCTYWGADKDKRNFEIFIDGVLFRKVNLTGEHGNGLYNEVYDIPTSFTKGKDKITVKFQSLPDNFAGGLFGFKILNEQ